MAARKTVKAVVELEDDTIPAWQRQSMDRSLRSARARAHARSDRFVAAATRLLQEKASTDFTVQDVVERSKMSIRTFYKYFASKEDLLVAVSETVVAREAVPRLRERIEKHRDPLLRLRAFILALVELTARARGSVARALTSYQNRLAESRPTDLARAMKPQLDLLAELIEDVARTRPLQGDLTVERAARLTHDLLLATVHGRALGSDGGSEVPATAVWQFCASGMGFGAAGGPGVRRTSKVRHGRRSAAGRPRSAPTRTES
jgi:AcrR family transcriptional regulator